MPNEKLLIEFVSHLDIINSLGTFKTKYRVK